MKVIGPGHFEQGSADNDVRAAPTEHPQHVVILSYPLAIGVQEVTKAQFQEFAEAMGRDMLGCESYDGVWQRRAS